MNKEVLPPQPPMRHAVLGVLIMISCVAAGVWMLITGAGGWW